MLNFLLPPPTPASLSPETLRCPSAPGAAVLALTPPATLTEFAPPRGSWQSMDGTAPRAGWMNPAKLRDPEWREGGGKILLGRDAGNRTVAYGDDRHMVTIAGSRAGKTATLLVPALRDYPGSAVVIDPKGELAELTGPQRSAMGQAVYVLDPFGELNRRAAFDPKVAQRLGVLAKSASFNALDELRLVEPDYLAGEAAGLADALIVANDKDPHWTDSARRIVQAVIMHLLESAAEPGKPDYPANMISVAQFFASTDVQARIYAAMAHSDNSLLQAVAATNKARLAGESREYGSIISTADAQLGPLLDLSKISDRSDFALADLKRKPMTLYLVLPASKMGSHYRWLRLIVTLALSALEREQTKPEFPVLFVLEEFAALGYMRPIERAAGFIAGFGVKLWSILQDIPQLRTHYRDSYETFLGNAGMINAFALNDGTTEEFISRRLGMTQYEELEPRQQESFAVRRVDVPKIKKIGRLLEPHELREFFARETWRQIIMIPGQQPISLYRFPFDA